MGIGTYNEHCRSIVMRYSSEWETIVSRLGRWIDFENDYKTLDTTFMESVWWVFKQLFDKNLVYRGFKVNHFERISSPPQSKWWHWYLPLGIWSMWLTVPAILISLVFLHFSHTWVHKANIFVHRWCHILLLARPPCQTSRPTCSTRTSVTPPVCCEPSQDSLLTFSNTSDCQLPDWRWAGCQVARMDDHTLDSAQQSCSVRESRPRVCQDYRLESLLIVSACMLMKYARPGDQGNLHRVRKQIGFPLPCPQEGEGTP